MTYDSAYYEELRPSTGIARMVDELRDWLVARIVRRRVPHGRLLDVGCGRGDLLARFEGTHALHGIELSEAGLHLARERLPVAELRSADIQRALPFAGRFEAITAVNVIEHLVDPGAAVANLAAVQPRGSLLVIHLPTIGNEGQRRRYMDSYDSDPTHVYRPSGVEVTALVEAAGYQTLLSAYAPFLPFRVWTHLPWQPAFLAAFERV